MAEQTVMLSLARRRLWILGTLVVLAFAGAISVLLIFNAPDGSRSSLVELELARDAASFGQALRTHWLETRDAPVCWPGSSVDQGGSSLMTLRCNLLADSMLFVPGYAGLLVFFILMLTNLPPRVGDREAWRVVGIHCLCFIPVAAGFFDIAENGMTARAGDDWLESLLADATVLDVRLSSLLKWLFTAASFALVGVLAGFSARSPQNDRAARTYLLLCAVAAVVTAALLVAGAWFRPSLLSAGMGAAVVTLAGLAAWYTDATGRRPTHLVGA